MFIVLIFSGSKRKAVQKSNLSASSSSSTPISVSSQNASQRESGTVGDGSGTQGEVGTVGGGSDDQNVIVLNDDVKNEPVGKRTKKCTSFVWKYFRKDKEIVEINGKQYE